MQRTQRRSDRALNPVNMWLYLKHHAYKPIGFFQLKVDSNNQWRRKQIESVLGERGGG